MTARRTRHSARRGDERGVVVPSRMMVVAIVVVAVAGVMYLVTAPGRQDDATEKAARSAASTSPKGPASTPAKPTPSASPSAPSATATTPEPSAAPVVRRAVAVAVFNNSGQRGLAGRTAQKVTTAGWKALGTDNWYGTVPATTVYYPGRLKPAAVLLARDLGITRVKPSTKPMRFDRLTVILTSDYRG